MSAPLPRAHVASAALGRRGEALVAAQLAQQGFELLAQNARVGRLELDLIARRGSLLVFCEVRTRASRAVVDPADTVDAKKRARVRRAAAAWLAMHPDVAYEELRLDAASVVIEPLSEPVLTYYEDAF